MSIKILPVLQMLFFGLLMLAIKALLPFATFVFNHVCNCGYMVLSEGRGLATSMCEHSLVIAKELGYKAMQFNFVASSNEGAVKLWTKLGFETVGTLPKAFNHPSKGYVDALVMYKCL